MKLQLLWRLLIARVVGRDSEITYLCEHGDCVNEGIDCWLPDDIDTASHHYCIEHCYEEGFCWGCGQFWAGVETFDFNARGLCDNCRDDPDATGEEAASEDEFDEYGDPYGGSGWDEGRQAERR